MADDNATSSTTIDISGSSSHHDDNDNSTVIITAHDNKNMDANSRRSVNHIADNANDHAGDSRTNGKASNENENEKEPNNQNSTTKTTTITTIMNPENDSSSSSNNNNKNNHNNSGKTPREKAAMNDHDDGHQDEITTTKTTAVVQDDIVTAPITPIENNDKSEFINNKQISHHNTESSTTKSAPMPADYDTPNNTTPCPCHSHNCEKDEITLSTPSHITAPTNHNDQNNETKHNNNTSSRMMMEAATTSTQRQSAAAIAKTPTALKTANTAPNVTKSTTNPIATTTTNTTTAENTTKSLAADPVEKETTSCDKDSTIYQQWHHVTNVYLQQPLLRGVKMMALWSARNPWMTVTLGILVAITLAVAGIFTNFELLTDGPDLWAPRGTLALEHGIWIEHDSQFPESRHGFLSFVLHKEGANVLTYAATECLFDVVDAIRAVPGYHDACQDAWGDDECPIISATALFDHNRTLFHESIYHSTSDKLVQVALSKLQLDNNGQPVNRDFYFGYSEPSLPEGFNILAANQAINDNNTDTTITSTDSVNPSDLILTSAQSFLGLVPKLQDDSHLFEWDATQALLDLQEHWNENGVDCQVQVNSYRALDDETKRGAEDDIPMMALAFIIMGLFCALYLSNCRDSVQSRTLLGLGAVITIALSVATSYGLLFCIGVPFTPIAQVFPYVMVGIGLDDTFIITGAFFRLPPHKPVIERVETCMEEIGTSIIVSTLTTVVAFSMGTATSMPIIRWFCVYAAPTVLIDFFYQISFFVALLVIDDGRVQDGRYDCLVCVHAKHTSLDTESVDDDVIAANETDEAADGNENNSLEAEEVKTEINQSPEITPPNTALDMTNSKALAEKEATQHTNSPQAHAAGASFVAKVMNRYCDILLQPATKVFVIAMFSLLFCLGIYGATQQKQELDFLAMMPADSFVKPYYDALHEYSSEYSYGLLFMRAEVYFRDVDVSDPSIQQQMRNYVDELVEMPYISSPPELFWLRDFSYFQEATNDTWVADLSFNDQLGLFLMTPPFGDLYRDDIVRDENGTVLASRCEVVLDQGSNYDIQVQADTVKLIRQVTDMQPINMNDDNGNGQAFFMFTPHFYAWEIHDLMTQELVLTLVLGLVSVFVISLLFIPHPFGACVLTSIVGAVYCQLMAFLGLVGVYINVVSAIGLLMSIGLIVDYNMHVFLTYCEIQLKHRGNGNKFATRDETVREALTTMGSSILVGGVTTMTSALPLGLTASLAFQTFFFTFLAIPVFGVAHGLILLPVILSLWGPQQASIVASEQPTLSASDATTPVEVVSSNGCSTMGITSEEEINI